MEDGQLSDSDSDMTVAPSDRPLQVPVSVEGGRLVLGPARGARAAGSGDGAAAAARRANPGSASRCEQGPRGWQPPGGRRAAVFSPPSMRPFSEFPTSVLLGHLGGQILRKM